MRYILVILSVFMVYGQACSMDKKGNKGHRSLSRTVEPSATLVDRARDLLERTTRRRQERQNGVPATAPSSSQTSSSSQEDELVTKKALNDEMKNLYDVYQAATNVLVAAVQKLEESHTASELGLLVGELSQMGGRFADAYQANTTVRLLEAYMDICRNPLPNRARHKRVQDVLEGLLREHGYDVK